VNQKHGLKNRLSSPSRLNKLTSDVRHLVYANCNLPQGQVAAIEQMIEQSAQRDVGKGALHNMKVCFASRKNDAARILESHTCEGVFALELELDPDVLGYQTQVPCQGIERTKATGRRHVSAAHIDFLVFKERSIELVECKTHDWLERNSVEPDSEWIRKDASCWDHRWYQPWAQQRGLSFRVWASPAPVEFYLRNLELIYSYAGQVLSPQNMGIAYRAHALLRKSAHTIDELAEQVTGFNEETALWLLVKREVFGCLKSASLRSTGSFLLTSSREQAEILDMAALRQLSDRIADPEGLTPLTAASLIDLKKGRQRLRQVEAVRTGELKPTRRIASLAKKVDAALKDGVPPLLPCLTNYAKSGNRVSRLSVTQQELMDETISQYWRSAQWTGVCQLHHLLRDRCETALVPPPSIRTLRRAIKKQSLAARVLATGGMRAYQAIRPMSDPARRSGHALAFGHTIHIDSSDVDNRSPGSAMKEVPAQKPRIYLAVDDATTAIMAHVIYFGFATSDALAVLMREYVYRHAHLPCVVILDRGPENTSTWMKDFCLIHGITIKYTPTAGSRFNGEAEAAIKAVNSNVSHRLPGSTLPDAYGRAVDGRHKSRKTARVPFIQIHQALLHYLYTSHPNRPNDLNETPHQRRDQLLSAYGMAGSPQQSDQSFLIQTSVPLTKGWSASEREGIRTKYGRFINQDMCIAMRLQRVTEVRADCVDPTVLHVRVGDRYFHARHRFYPRYSQLSDPEKMWRSGAWELKRLAAKAAKDAHDRDQHRYIENLRGEISMGHLKSQSPAVPDQDETSTKEHENGPAAWDPDASSIDPCDME
jgi:putative transposase